MHHQPAADVAFKPEVGVNGRKVVPADLEPDRHIKLPDVIAIPLHIPVRSLLKPDTAAQLGGSEIGIGLVTVDRHSGEVKYEGQTLVLAQSERMVAACRKLRRGKY